MIKKKISDKKSNKLSLFLTERELIILIIVATIATLVTTYLAVLKQEKLLTSAPIDTGIFVNVIQNILHGNFFITTIGLTEHVVSDQPCHPNAFYCIRSKPEDIKKRERAVVNLINSSKWKLIEAQEGIILLQKVF